MRQRVRNYHITTALTQQLSERILAPDAAVGRFNPADKTVCQEALAALALRAQEEKQARARLRIGGKKPGAPPTPSNAKPVKFKAEPSPVGGDAAGANAKALDSDDDPTFDGLPSLLSLDPAAMAARDTIAVVNMIVLSYVGQDKYTPTSEIPSDMKLNLPPLIFATDY